MLALWLSALATSAGAADHDVLIVGGGSPELVRKLRAESAYAGFRPLERASTERAPVTLRVLSSDRVELSVEGVDPKRRFQQTLVSEASERDSFALRVVEQMRARLVEVGWSLPEEPPSPGESSAVGDPNPASPAAGADWTGAIETASSAEVNATGGRTHASARVDGVGTPSDRADDRVRVWLDAGIASSWASGGLGVAPQAALGARLDLGAGWHGRAASLWPLLDAEVEAIEGEARVAWTGFSAALARSLPVSQPWIAQAGVGAGLMVIDARGEARGDFSGRRQRLHAGVYFAEASFGRELASWLRLRASALGGVSAPRPVLRFDEREVASLGRFIGSLTLGLELTWPRTAEGP